MSAALAANVPPLFISKVHLRSPHGAAVEAGADLEARQPAVV